MFSIYTPQTIELQVKRPDVLDDKGAPVAAEASEGDFHGTLAFDHESSDVSKCRMVITRDDKVWTYTFNTHGLLVDSTYEDDESRKAKADAEKKAAEDLKAQRAQEQANAAAEKKAAEDLKAQRAQEQANADAEKKAAEDLKAQRAQEQANADAEKKAAEDLKAQRAQEQANAAAEKKAAEDLKAQRAQEQANADAEKKAAEDLKAQRAQEQANAAASAAHELKTADDTTAADKAWDASVALPPPSTPPGPNPFAPLENLNAST